MNYCEAGHPNRPEARWCRHCGDSLAAGRSLDAQLAQASRARPGWLRPSRPAADRVEADRAALRAEERARLLAAQQWGPVETPPSRSDPDVLQRRLDQLQGRCDETAKWLSNRRADLISLNVDPEGENGHMDPERRHLFAEYGARLSGFLQLTADRDEAYSAQTRSYERFALAEMGAEGLPAAVPDGFDDMSLGAFESWAGHGRRGRFSSAPEPSREVNLLSLN
ncbi:MAG: hypothetical protein ACLQDY_08345 [Streptosporangiaceae bacterium]